MSEEFAKTRTRAGLKSCLRITPPTTPDYSAASSPCNSGRTSPSLVSDSGSSVSSCCGRKTVSFCSDNELEEVFWADEWDRTPAAVTPKLSYQDILELKQLRVNLPPPSSRQPFTTSTSSSSKPALPVSRFASAASHTPTKWKNRSEQQRTHVDPEILPYLDAVPIRLLPLLPQSPTDPEQSAPTTLSDPHPQTPTPTASPESQPTLNPPSEPPDLTIVPVSPIIPVLAPPRPKKSNFAFLPLLPTETPSYTPTIPSSAPPPPKRKINMTFLPVNAAPEQAPSPSLEQELTRTAREKVDVWIGSALPTPPPSASVHYPCSRHLPAADSQATPLTPPRCTSDISSISPPSSLSLHPPSSLATSIDSDKDTETDAYTDTDAESDAPSVSTFGSSLPSPPLDQGALNDLKLDSELVPPGYFPRIWQEVDSGSYFPPVITISTKGLSQVRTAVISPTHSCGPGQTPPLSVLYPSPTLQTQPLHPLDAISASSHSQPSCEESEPSAARTSLERDADLLPPLQSSLPLTPAPVTAALDGPSLPSMPLSMSQSLQKKLILEALPSPALLPPSPFELEPQTRVGAGDKSDGVSRVARPDTTPVLRAKATAMITPEDSPMPTLESVRASWDAHARSSIAVSCSGSVATIAPSISRKSRRLS